MRLIPSSRRYHGQAFQLSRVGAVTAKPSKLTASAADRRASKMLEHVLHREKSACLLLAPLSFDGLATLQPRRTICTASTVPVLMKDNNMIAPHAANYLAGVIPTGAARLETGAVVYVIHTVLHTWTFGLELDSPAVCDTMTSVCVCQLVGYGGPLAFWDTTKILPSIVVVVMLSAGITAAGITRTNQHFMCRLMCDLYYVPTASTCASREVPHVCLCVT